MTKRYGRNQRRKHREEIAALKDDLRQAMIFGHSHRQRADDMEARASAAMARARRLEEHAFQHFMRNGNRIQRLLDRMADEVGRKAGEQLKRLFEDAVRERLREMTPEDIASLRVDPWEYRADDLPVTGPVKTIYLQAPALRWGLTLTDKDLLDAKELLDAE